MFLTIKAALGLVSGFYAKLSIGSCVGFLLTTIVGIVMLHNFKKIAGLSQVNEEDENKRSFFQECLNACLNGDSSSYHDEWPGSLNWYKNSYLTMF